MKSDFWFKGHPKGSTYVVLSGLIVKRSKNLRGLLAYGRKSKPVKVETRKCLDNPHNGELRVTYSDGAQGFAWFRSHSILIDWTRSRKSWRNNGAQFLHHSGDVGYLTKPGIIAGGLEA